MLRSRGFTLLETLVTLIVTALTVALLFQIVSGFDRARSVAARFETVQGNRSVMLGWFRDSVGGMVAVDPASVPGTTNPHAPIFGLKGAATGFTGVSLAPLQQGVGIPTKVTWRIVSSPTGGALQYTEAGSAPVTLDLGVSLRGFVYFDKDGKPHRSWPPRLGIQAAMPAGIALESGANGHTVTYAAVAVAHPLELPAYTDEGASQ